MCKEVVIEASAISELSYWTNMSKTYFWGFFAPEFMCKEVVIEASAILKLLYWTNISKTYFWGPMGLKFIGNSKGSKERH